jgi:hypothetical protein
MVPPRDPMTKYGSNPQRWAVCQTERAKQDGPRQVAPPMKSIGAV